MNNNDAHIKNKQAIICCKANILLSNNLGVLVEWAAENCQNYIIFNQISSLQVSIIHRIISTGQQQFQHSNQLTYFQVCWPELFRPSGISGLGPVESFPLHTNTKTALALRFLYCLFCTIFCIRLSFILQELLPHLCS